MTLVVSRRRPFLALLSLLLTGALAWAAAWWTMSEQNQSMLADAERGRSEREALRQENGALEQERQQLTRRIAVLERARQVETQAYARVDVQLAQLQDELLELKEELAFYKGILSEANTGGGVRIQRFVVEPDGAGEYLFRLVLTRGIRSDNVATGTISLAVDGENDGQLLRLRLEELRPFPAPPLKYSFKHFQRFEGQLRLPPGFEAKRVIVLVEADRKGSRPLRETFPWPGTNS